MNVLNFCLNNKGISKYPSLIYMLLFWINCFQFNLQIKLFFLNNTLLACILCMLNSVFAPHSF